MWYLDLWPLGPPQLVITDPDMALHLTAIENTPKHPIERMFVEPVVGVDNIVTTEGPYWKYLHKLLAPAFAKQYIRKMVPSISEEAMTFRSILHKYADRKSTRLNSSHWE